MIFFQGKSYMYAVLKVQPSERPSGSVGWSAALSRRRSRVRVSSGSSVITADADHAIWGLSSAGRAPALQAGGHRFEPCRPHRSQFNLDGFPSGQRGQTVNLLQIASVVRIHLHPFESNTFNFIESMSSRLCRCGSIGRAADL